MTTIDSYEIETEDTTASSSSENNKVQLTTDKRDVKAKAVQSDVEIDSDVQEIQPTTDKRDVEEKCERPDSPDNSMVKMSRTRCTLVDKVPQRRDETRS